MRAASALLVAVLIGGCSADEVLGPEGGSITLSISSTDVMRRQQVTYDPLPQW